MCDVCYGYVSMWHVLLNAVCTSIAMYEVDNIR